jgi:hypothetical protein
MTAMTTADRETRTDAEASQHTAIPGHERLESDRWDGSPERVNLRGWDSSGTDRFDTERAWPT